jgi:hypothetical protein
MIINIFNTFLMLGVVSREDKGGGPLMLDVARNMSRNMGRLDFDLMANS